MIDPRIATAMIATNHEMSEAQVARSKQIRKISGLARNVWPRILGNAQTITESGIETRTTTDGIIDAGPILGERIVGRIQTAFIPLGEVHPTEQLGYRYGFGRLTVYKALTQKEVLVKKRLFKPDEVDTVVSADGRTVGVSAHLYTALDENPAYDLSQDSERIREVSWNSLLHEEFPLAMVAPKASCYLFQERVTDVLRLTNAFAAATESLQVSNT